MSRRTRGWIPAILVLLLLGPASGVAQRGSTQVNPRARPPQWNHRETQKIFFGDAFRDGLVGERPMPPPTAAVQSPKPPMARGESSAGSFLETRHSWSKIISAETIEDEVKAIKIQADQTVTTPQKFASGGYLIARRHFSVLAMLFSVIRDYDGTVRWKSDAPSAVSLFAHAASVAKVGSLQVYQIAKARMTDLHDLVGGGSLTSSGPTNPDWEQLADRVPLMQRLEQALDERLAQWTATDADFSAHKAEAVHDAEMVAVIAEFLTQEGMEDGSDDQYAGFCKRMKEAAQQVRDAVQLNQRETASKAVSAIRRSCVHCHESYRG